MDFGTLAQLSSPGAALPGMEGSMVNRWHDMNNRQQYSLDQAIPLAENDALMNTQKTQEFMQGAPGRSAGINLGNMRAADAVTDYPQERAAKLRKDLITAAKDNKEVQDVFADITDLGNAYVNADDDAGKARILEAAKGRKLRNGYVMGSEPERDKMLLDVAGEIGKSDPKLMSKERIEEAKLANKITVTAMQQAGLDGRLAATLTAKEAVARIKAAEAAKPLNEGQGLVKYLDAEFGGNPRAWLEGYSQLKGYTASIKPNQQAGTAENLRAGKGLVVPRPEAVQLPPSAPPAAPTQAPTQTPQFEVGKIYQDAKGNRAKWNGKSWEPV